MQPSLQIEVVVRSPLGEIRAFYDAAGVLRTEVRCDYAPDPGAAEHARQMLACVELVQDQVKGLTLRGPLAQDGARNAFEAWRKASLIVTAGARTLATDLYQDYLAHCVAAGERPMSQRVFGMALGDLGFRTAGKNSQGQLYRGGVALRPAEGSRPQAVAPAQTAV